MNAYRILGALTWAPLLSHVEGELDDGGGVHQEMDHDARQDAVRALVQVSQSQAEKEQGIGAGPCPAWANANNNPLIENGHAPRVRPVCPSIPAARLRLRQDRAGRIGGPRIGGMSGSL